MYFPVKKLERKERMGSSFVNMSKTEALQVCDLWHIYYLLTESEAITRKSQIEDLMY